MEDSTDPRLSTASEGAVLTVWLDRPAARNAIDEQMAEELRALFDRLRWEDGVDLVLVRGRGPSFCAGVDFKQLAGKDAAWVNRRRNLGLDAYLAIERCPAPTVAVVHGAAIGGGAEVAAACDFVLSRDDTVFQWPESLRDSVGATQRLARIVGRAAARELLFTGRRIDAAEALRLGFVNRVCPGDEALETAVAEVRGEILRCSGRANRLIKAAMSAGEACDRATAVDIERQAIAQHPVPAPGRIGA